MSVLEAVLSMKAQERAQQQAQFAALENAASNFLNARNMAIQQRQNERRIDIDEMMTRKQMEGIDSQISERQKVNPLDELLARKRIEQIDSQIKASGAVNPLDDQMKMKQMEEIDSKIKARSSLSPLEELLQLGKAIDAARSIGDMDTVNLLMSGNKPAQVNDFLSKEVGDSMPPTPLDPDADLYRKSTETKFNPMTGKMDPTPESLAAKDRLTLKNKIAEKEETQLFEAKKQFDKYQSDANQTLMAIDKIEAQAKKLPEFKRGMINQLGANFDVMVKKMGKEQEVTRYIGVVSQELIPMARKLMEEKGPITESDVQRVEKGLGDLTTPLEDKMFLLGELRDKVKKALELKKDIAQISDADISTKYQETFKRAGLLSDNEKPKVSRDEAIQELRRRGKIK